MTGVRIRRRQRSSYYSLAALFDIMLGRAIQLEFPDQGAARYAEQIRRLLLMPAGLSQYPADGLLLEAVERILVFGGIVPALNDLERQIAGLDPRTGREQDRLVQRVPEFPYVTGPGI